jgi:hypothetical protein
MPKAWRIEIIDDDEGRAAIVFAETRNLAKAQSEWDCTFIELRAVRAPEFDDVPAGELERAQLEDGGWWFECHDCYRHVSDETETRVYRDGWFCSSRCCIGKLRKERAHREGLWSALEHITTQAPGVQVFDVYRNYAGEFIGTVRFPGEKERVVIDLVNALMASHVHPPHDAAFGAAGSEGEAL